MQCIYQKMDLYPEYMQNFDKSFILKNQFKNGKTRFKNLFFKKDKQMASRYLKGIPCYYSSGTCKLRGQ